MAAKPPTGDQERELDDVLAKIDKALPKLHQRARTGEAGLGLTPTQAFSPAKLKRTRMAFQAMCDDSLLSDSGEDLKAEIADAANTAEDNAVLPKTVRLPPPPTPARINGHSR